MLTLIQVELYKIFRRPRTYIAFAAITALIVVIQTGLKLDGEAYADFIMQTIKQSFEFEGQLLNGYLVCYVLLQLLLVHVPLLISLIAADMISGEANLGTIRFLLTKPVSRPGFTLAKFIAASVYTIMLLLWIAFLALVVSVWIFGTDDLFIVKSNYAVQLSENDVLWRYAGAFCFAMLSMLTVTALGFFLSHFASNTIGPIVATMSVIVFFTILSTMSIPIFQKIQPYLFTTHMVNWKEFFDQQVDADNVAIAGSLQNPEKIIKSALVLIFHIAGFVGASVWIFREKDILS